jgi:hypothetical protein
MSANTPLTPAEMYLSEIPAANRPRAILAFETVASLQGLSDWRQTEWSRITERDLPIILEQFRVRFSTDDTRIAIASVKGAARCAWRQKLITGQQLAVIGKWKSEQAAEGKGD